MAPTGLLGAPASALNVGHVVICPAFTQQFSRPFADRLWSLGMTFDVVEYALASAPTYAAACEASIASALKAQVLRKPALIGYSLGGYFAAVAAARWPDLVSALVLIAAPRSLKLALDNVAKDLSVNPTEAARRLCERTALDPVRLVSELRRTPALEEAEGLAERIRAPTLVIAGSRDRVVPANEALDSKIPNAAFFLVDDSGSSRSAHSNSWPREPSDVRHRTHGLSRRSYFGFAGNWTGCMAP